MSTSRHVTIWCDGWRGGRRCWEWFDAGHESIPETRAAARAWGWSYVGRSSGTHRDLCISCSKGDQK